MSKANIAAGKLKRRKTVNMETGVITNIVIDRGFGFIRLDGSGKDAFFHMRDIGDGLQWGEQLKYQRVRCDVEQQDKGLRATRVCAAN